MAKRLPITGLIHHGLNIVWYRSLNPEMTQEKLSKLTGISQRDISTLEGKLNIDDEILEKFAKAFEINIKYLRDCVSYPSTIASMYFYDHSQLFKDSSKNEVHNPIEMMKLVFDEFRAELKEVYNQSTATIIESNNKHTLYLEKRIKELESDLKAERSK